jgi:type II secretory pathway component PulF
MFVVNQQYTIGRYNESPEGSLSTTGAALLASTLAWSANNKIPFHQTILSLTDTGRPRHGIIFFLLPNSRNWNLCLQAAYGDLVNGLPLYRVLRKRLGYFLPEYYLQAVEKAEKDGMLPEVLPHFARRMNLASEIRHSYRVTLAIPFMEFMLIVAVLTGLATFIIPNFGKLFNELLAGEPHPFNSGFTGASLSLFSAFGHNLFYIILFILLIMFLFRSFRNLFTMILEEMIIHLPYFRKQLKNMAMLELSASLASYLSAGEDILNAMKFSRSSCNHLWLRRKLGRCIRQMENGTGWLDAWQQMKLNQPLNDWIICNASARQEITSGFDTMTDWLYHNAIRHVRKNTFWLSLLCIFVNAVIVFTVAYAIFAALSMIIKKLG